MVFIKSNSTVVMTPTQDDTACMLRSRYLKLSTRIAVVVLVVGSQGIASVRGDMGIEKPLRGHGHVRAEEQERI